MDILFENEFIFQVNVKIYLKGICVIILFERIVFFCFFLLFFCFFLV